MGTPRRNLRLVLTTLLLGATGFGCTSNLSRFDIINLQNSSKIGIETSQITRAEVADNASGLADDPGTPSVGAPAHIRKITAGGWYLRRVDPTASAPGVNNRPGSTNFLMGAGLHANPAAQK